MTKLGEAALSRLNRAGLLQKLQNSALAVAIVTLIGYLIIFALFYRIGPDLRNFAFIGQPFITRSTVSPVIKFDPGYHYLEYGYDSQYFYFIALDPVNAHYYFEEVATYRYTRILYPMVARLLALGNPDWIPLTLVLVNLLAVTLGTWAMAAWCRLHKLSPWYALVYAFFVGQVMSFTRDLSEVLAYALLALAIYIFSRWPEKILWAGLLFGLSALAHETTLLFSAFYALRLFWQSRVRVGVVQALLITSVFGLLVFGPTVLWRIFLLNWQGSLGLETNATLLQIPLLGLYKLYPFKPENLEVVQAVLVPAAICTAIVLWTMWRDKTARTSLELWLLLLNSVVFALMLDPIRLIELYGAARISLGMVVAAIYSLPYIKGRAWFYLCAGLWLTPTLIFVLSPAVTFLDALRKVRRA